MIDQVPHRKSLMRSAHCPQITDVHTCYSSTSRKLLKILNTLTISLTAFIVIATSVFFTIIFVDLTLHGLSASHVGSILLSMAIPTMIFGLSFIVKRKFNSHQSATDNVINYDSNCEYQSLGEGNAEQK